MYYRIEGNRVYDFADYKYADDCLEYTGCTMDDYFKDNVKYIVQDGRLTENPNYEEDKKKQLKDTAQQLSCTKRVMALVLQEYGISYEALKQLISANEQAQLEWDLCERLERSNPLLNIFGEQLGITEEQIDNIFLYANGLIDSEALREDAGTDEPEVSE